MLILASIVTWVEAQHGTIQHFLKNCPLKVEQPLMIEEKNYTKTWRVFRATNNK